ncbi:MAG: hypothetical protein O9320_19115 [Magnetospirillum sp.]|jgi:hypothetical protein|nr:hypothetical protein [Magnetospirillum sp.]
MTANLRRFAVPLLLLCVAVLGGCAGSAPPRGSIVDGGLRLFADGVPGVHGNADQRQWWTSRPNGAGDLALVDLQGSIALRADAPGGMQMGRRLSTALTATPYLRWTWYLEPAVFGGGPGAGLERGMRVTIYFRTPNRSASGGYLAFLGMGAEEWDRSVEIAFGGFGAGRSDGATQSKWAVDNAGRRLELRPPRTGQAGAWHVEAIDLSEVYRYFWPGESLEDVQIAIIAAGGFSGRVPPEAGIAIGYVAEISISR